MKDDGKLVIVNEKKEKKEFSILMKFDIKERNKSFVIYTDYTVNKNGNTRIFASIYHPEDPNNMLEEIVEEDELKVVNEYVKKLEKALNQ